MRLGIGIDADLVAARPAQKPMHRHAPELAGQVPQGHVDAGDGVYQERPAAHVAMAAVQLLPQVLDARRVLAVQQFEERLGQEVGRARLQGADLAPARHLAIGFDLHENLVAHQVRAQAIDADGGPIIDNVGGGVLHGGPPVNKF